MKILITGGTGFVGKNLCKELILGNHELVILTRNRAATEKSFPLPAEIYEWKDSKELPPKEAFEGVDAVLHLMGESIAEGRWNKAKKEALMESRVDSTKNLVLAIEQYSNHKVRSFVSTSATGFYKDSITETSNEDSEKGQGFLSDLCFAWEEPLNKLSADIRQCIIRVGIVLGNGGAVEKLSGLFSYGVTSPLGSGEQWMSWVHIDDLTSLYKEALENQKFKGVFNACGGASKNKDFHSSLAKVMSRPLLPPTPEFVLKLALGEMSSALLSSQRVESNRLAAMGFSFKYTQLNQALENLLPFGSFTHVLEEYQFFKGKDRSLFEFFTLESNLERITPPFLNFKVLKKSTEEITAGTLIDYQLKLHGIPIKWKTEIRSWQEGIQFKDFQLKGPYQVWDHTHSFVETKSGLLMIDKVYYKLPIPALSDAFVSSMVRKDVRKIFGYRRQILNTEFGE